MVSVALLVRLEAKPGKESEVEKFIRDGLPVVQEEPATTDYLVATAPHGAIDIWHL